MELVFLGAAFLAALTTFHLAERVLDTHWLINSCACVCVWASVMWLGAAFGPWVDASADAVSAVLAALTFLGLAAAAYILAYGAQRLLASEGELGAQDLRGDAE